MRKHHDPPADQGKSAADLEIHAGMLLTMVDETVVEGAVIRVKDGLITSIGPLDKATPPAPDSPNVIDARDAIVMPGLINAHAHAAMTLFRGFSDDLSLKTWLFERIFPAEARWLNSETVYWGALLGCLEMIGSGTTTFADGYFFQDATVRAVHEAGLRALVAQGIIDYPAPGVPDPAQNMRVGREFMERWTGFSGLIRPGLFVHSPVTCSDETLTEAYRLSRYFGSPLQIHLSETLDEAQAVIRRTGLRPVFHLNRLGLLHPSLIAAHAIHLDDEEVGLLAEKGVKPVHVPESNMKLCSGVARVAEMIRRGLKVGLGTDGCASNNDMDLLQEMDTAAKLGKVFSGDPTNLKARDVLKMSTTWGAAVLGLENEVGTIAVGKRADIIVVDLNRPHLRPVYDPFSLLVYSANGADVRDVFVNGCVLMKDRVFQTIDAQEVMGRVREIARQIGREHVGYRLVIDPVSA
jgi:5-methylthioadenosine/S-adenosylhomocysteine deaminase